MSYSFPIAMVVSNFNTAITKELQRAVTERLMHYGLQAKDLYVMEVPGAIEIPLIAKYFAMSKKVQVIIALGAVIRGATSHYDYVCAQVSNGCQQVMLSYDIPVIFGVLTTENEEQAWERLGGKEGHKGIDAADCAIKMYDAVQEMSRLGLGPTNI